ncbi:MAG TPA: hypothetical protein PLY93_10000 [Turneriella sp.]|nr:hypothetical protein [Turneriella sp.]
MRFVLLFPLFFLTIGCGLFKTHGEFSFAVADQSMLPVLEQHFFYPKRFIKPQTTPIFESDDVLWYAYRPHNIDATAFYGISLQKKTLGFQEIDLRNRIIPSGQNLIIDKYERLEEGEYRLRVAYQNKVIDQIDFIIVADSATESIDYEKDESEI